MSKPLKDQVYEYVIQKVQLGEIFPNEKITEVAIAKEMGISRTPVREALIEMTSDGVLEKTKNKGLVIKEYTTKDKYETYQIIGVLDGLAGTLAADHLTEDDILKMKELTERMDIAIKYRNYQEYGKLKQKFHAVYINKSGNETLINLLNSMVNSSMPKTYFHEDEDKLFQLLSDYSNREHKELVELFKLKDYHGIGEKLKQHWEVVDEEAI